MLRQAAEASLGATWCFILPAAKRSEDTWCWRGRQELTAACEQCQCSCRDACLAPFNTCMFHNTRSRIAAVNEQRSREITTLRQWQAAASWAQNLLRLLQ